MSRVGPADAVVTVALVAGVGIRPAIRILTVRILVIRPANATSTWLPGGPALAVAVHARQAAPRRAVVALVRGSRAPTIGAARVEVGRGIRLRLVVGAARPCVALCVRRRLDLRVHRRRAVRRSRARALRRGRRRALRRRRRLSRRTSVRITGSERRSRRRHQNEHPEKGAELRHSSSRVAFPDPCQV
jgi:hypothetical protein